MNSIEARKIKKISLENNHINIYQGHLKEDSNILILETQNKKLIIQYFSEIQEEGCKSFFIHLPPGKFISKLSIGETIEKISLMISKNPLFYLGMKQKELPNVTIFEKDLIEFIESLDETYILLTEDILNRIFENP